MRFVLKTRLAGSLFLLLAFWMVGSPLLRAQESPSGEWNNIFDEDIYERIPGPNIGDYLGLPINAEDRARGDAWAASLLELPENQCRPHPSDYAWRGPFLLRFWNDIDRLTQQDIAYHTHGSWQQPEQTIWMDGRPEPPMWAAHTWQGFSTGKWDGDDLVITTTHMKEGWIRRNGIQRSDYATVRTHIMRHGNFLTVAVIVYDPVYLTEPFIRTTDFMYNPQQHIDPYPCEAVEETEHTPGVIPHHLPGTNTFLNEFATKWGIPPEAARGGAETMYPEYIKKMETMKRLPRPTHIDYGLFN